MINLMYIPFLLFIIAAYFYYHQKLQNRERYYKSKRNEFLYNNPGLTEEQTNNLNLDLPWIGMESSLLTELFGDPKRKRVLDQSMKRIIWSYPNLFVYLNEDKVAEWKSR